MMSAEKKQEERYCEVHGWLSPERVRVRTFEGKTKSWRQVECKQCFNERRAKAGRVSQSFSRDEADLVHALAIWLAGRDTPFRRHPAYLGMIKKFVSVGRRSKERRGD